MKTDHWPPASVQGPIDQLELFGPVKGPPQTGAPSPAAKPAQRAAVERKSRRVGPSQESGSKPASKPPIEADRESAERTDAELKSGTIDTPWMSTPKAAAYLGLSPRTLEDFRTKGGGPAYCRPSGNLVRYHRNDLDAWVEAGKARHTAEELARRTRSGA